MAQGVQVFEDAYVIGFGETQYHKRNQWHPLQYMIEAARLVLETTNIKPEEIDGLAINSFRLYPENVVTVAEHLGLELTWSMHGAQGGASSVIQTIHAAEAIDNGVANTILILSGDAFTVDVHMDLMNRFNPPLRDYVAPYGFGGPNGLFALIQRRHMTKYGTKVEQLAQIAVTQRENASRNPNALLREPLTLNDYLSARIIADPLRLYDCVLPCGGGGAILVANRRIAKKINTPTAKIVAGAERTNYCPNDPLPLSTGIAAFSEILLQMAGIRHTDLDFIQLYDDYPIMVAIQLEDLGFCPKGKVGEFIEKVDLTIEGEIPLNTGGGQLSCGQAGAAGGIIGLVEGIRQLTGYGEDRQVIGADLGLVSGYGMVGYGHGLCSAVVIISGE